MRKIKLPGLLTGRRKAPAKAPSATRTQDLGVPVFRNRGGSHRAPESTRAQLAARPASRGRYGQRQTPRDTAYRHQPAASRSPIGQGVRRGQGEASEYGTRNYPPRSDRLRIRPVIRAGTRHQLAERHERLASTRMRNTSTEKTRRQMQARPGSIQVHTYPRPYERTPARPPTRVAPGTTIPVGGKKTTLGGEVVRSGGRQHELGETAPSAVARKHPARGVAPRPSAGLPGDVTPTNRLAGARTGGAPHPYWSKR